MQLVSRAVATRSAIPAHGGVMIEAADDHVVLSATDGELSMRSRIAAAIDAPGVALVPGRLAVDVLRSLSGDSVTLEHSDSGELTITSDQAKFSLRALPVEDFPRLPQANAGESVTLPAEAFSETITRVARAASRDETRPVLTGILVSASGSDLRMVATDSYRLSVKKTKLEGEISGEFESNVPARALQELSRVVGEVDAPAISIESQENQIVFTVDRVMLASRVIDGQFPNFQQLLPDQFEHEITLNRDELLTVVRRISLMAQRNAPLRLKFENGNLTVSAQTPDVGEAAESLAVPYQGDVLEIGFNPQFLQDGLESLDSKDLVLKLIHPHRPGLIEAAGESGDEGSFLYLIMPVRLNV